MQRLEEVPAAVGHATPFTWAWTSGPCSRPSTGVMRVTPGLGIWVTTPDARTWVVPVDGDCGYRRDGSTYVPFRCRRN